MLGLVVSLYLGIGLGMIISGVLTDHVVNGNTHQFGPFTLLFHFLCWPIPVIYTLRHARRIRGEIDQIIGRK